MIRTVVAATALALLSIGSLHAETLLVDRVKHESRAMPSRGMRAADVEKRFGAPRDRLQPRGGQKRQWPTIQRWVYPAFTVYFEHGRVVDAVANKATPTEIGPKPPIR
ncbi:hypothetical protein [Cognatilysobacter lacus]|uniref:Lipoprotein SmpA/OmlA domain-containing protein n=1 Tax=Cognatilysobacter lacus TaxID=1643323 RepID=A0A5D8ZB88_9GAMM|nr:hypothetical protein [Lysobacter lacus]TZF91382.1 hypothetical protein FW784_01890 [Lysobacter lacus]